MNPNTMFAQRHRRNHSNHDGHDCHDDHDDDLIVDFPSDGRLQSSISFTSDLEGALTLPKIPKINHRPKQNVRFSEMSMLAYIDLPTEQENKMKWDSSQDRKISRYNQSVDAARMRHIFETFPADSIPCEVLMLCIGIEKLLSHNHLAKALERRARHVRVVLFEQHRQREMGIYDVEELGRISEMDSLFARKRSYKIAKHYFEMEVD